MAEQTTSWNRTRFADRVGIEYPIIQGPMGGVRTQRLTAAVSNFGGLGSFGAYAVEPSQIKDIIAEIRSMTSKPFAMNLWVTVEDKGARSSGAEAFARSLAEIAGHIETLGGPQPVYAPHTPVRFEDQVRGLLDEKVPAFSFIYGIPPREILDEFRKQLITIIGTATTPDEAVALEDAGVDVVVASGFEAGGHRGSFLRSSEDSLMGTLSLVPQVADLIDLPVVAAGGIADARGVVAALALGADGVQMGTAFLACEESGASPHHRAALLSGKAGHTALTRGFTGRLGRGLKNQVMEELNRPGVAQLPFPLQRVLMRNLSVPADKAQDPELTPMWSGQSANLTRYSNAKAVLDALVSEIEPIASAVLKPREPRSNVV